MGVAAQRPWYAYPAVTRYLALTPPAAPAGAPAKQAFLSRGLAVRARTISRP